MTNENVPANHSGAVLIGRAIGVFKKKNIVATPNGNVPSRVEIRSAGVAV
jgi:hypothetical protein